MRRVWRGILLVVALVGGLSGCAPRKTDMLHFLRSGEHQVSAMEYRVGIPDVISISAPRILEIDGVVQTIQPDGKITLRLLGPVKVVGMTAKEIAAKLEVLLGKYYVDPKVSVTVELNSKKYYVYGQDGTVAKKYTGRDTLFDAVLPAAGDFRAWTSKVKVIRPSDDGKGIRTLSVNVDNMFKKGDFSENILLEPGDIVYVPPTPIAWIAQRLKEIIYPATPALRAYRTPADFIHADDDYEDLSN